MNEYAGSMRKITTYQDPQGCADDLVKLAMGDVDKPIRIVDKLQSQACDQGLWSQADYYEEVLTALMKIRTEQEN